MASGGRQRTVAFETPPCTPGFAVPIRGADGALGAGAGTSNVVSAGGP